jgi:hypothetical protein
MGLFSKLFGKVTQPDASPKTQTKDDRQESQERWVRENLMRTPINRIDSGTATRLLGSRELFDELVDEMTKLYNADRETVRRVIFDIVTNRILSE